MNIELKTSLLQGSVSKSTMCVTNNKLLPITSLISFKVKDNTLILTTSDGTNFLYVRYPEKVPCEDVEEFAVGADTFVRLVQKTTAEKISLSIGEEGNYLVVKGNGTYKLELPLDENGNPIVEYKSFDNLESSFHKLVKRSYDNAKELYDKEHGWRTDLDEYRKAPGAPINMDFLKQAHYQIGLRKSTAEKLVNFLDKYGRTDLYATRFRDLDRNVNQYMYTDYQILSRQYTRRRKENTLGEYLSCNGHNLEELEKLITSHELPILCFNDSGTKEEYVPFIRAFFERVFPKKSGYEK
jgi:hypothetical protein